MRLDRPTLGDVRVRQALLLGSDRAALSQKLFGGRQPSPAASSTRSTRSTTRA
jgi:ABC-type oligopeptide transport system substrate-binding subunit